MKELVKRSVTFFYKISIYYSLAAFLILLVILGSFDIGSKIFLQILPPLLGTISAGLFFDYLEAKKWQITPGPVISGLILGLVGPFAQNLSLPILLGVFAMASKFFIKLYGKNVLNPAGAGLAVGMMLGAAPSWWAGNAHFLFFYLWALGLLLKLKRWAPVASLLPLMMIFDGIEVLTSSSILFFALVMLIEPITSPIKIKSGLIHGASCAFLYFLLKQLTQIDPLIPALLINNIFGRLLDRFITK